MKILVKVEPSRATKPNNWVKYADSVLLSLFLRDNESTTSVTTLATTKRYSILNTKSIGVIDSEGPEKNNNTEMKSGDFLRPPHEVRIF